MAPMPPGVPGLLPRVAGPGSHLRPGSALLAGGLKGSSPRVNPAEGVEEGGTAPSRPLPPCQGRQGDKAASPQHHESSWSAAQDVVSRAHAGCLGGTEGARVRPRCRRGIPAPYPSTGGQHLLLTPLPCIPSSPPPHPRPADPTSYPIPLYPTMSQPRRAAPCSLPQAPHIPTQQSSPCPLPHPCTADPDPWPNPLQPRTV